MPPSEKEKGGSERETPTTKKKIPLAGGGGIGMGNNGSATDTRNCILAGRVVRFDWFGPLAIWARLVANQVAMTCSTRVPDHRLGMDIFARLHVKASLAQKKNSLFFRSANRQSKLRRFWLLLDFIKDSVRDTAERHLLGLELTNDTYVNNYPSQENKRNQNTQTGH